MPGALFPLAHLELWLRARPAPAASCRGTFIGHYLERIVYFDAPAPLLAAGTVLLAVVNLPVSGWMALKKRGREKVR